jgi:hypothetical protein
MGELTKGGEAMTTPTVIYDIADLRRLYGQRFRIVLRRFDLVASLLFECCAYSKTADIRRHLPLAQATGRTAADAAQALAEKLTAAGYPPRGEA